MKQTITKVLFFLTVVATFLLMSCKMREVVKVKYEKNPVMLGALKVTFPKRTTIFNFYTKLYCKITNTSNVSVQIQAFSVGGKFVATNKTSNRIIVPGGTIYGVPCGGIQEMENDRRENFPNAKMKINILWKERPDLKYESDEVIISRDK